MNNLNQTKKKKNTSRVIQGEENNCLAKKKYSKKIFLLNFKD